MSLSPVSRNPERTRRRLLNAAIRLFSARSYHGVSVDQIVALAKVNKRMVYHYFKSKAGLYQAALSEVYNRIEDVELHAVKSGTSPTEKLTRLLQHYSVFLDENPEFVQMVQWTNVERGRFLPKKNPVLSKDPFLKQFRQIVEEGMRIGEFRQNLEISHLLIHFIGLLFIYHSNRYSLSQGLHMDLGSPREKAKGLNQVLTLIFEGINAPGKGGAA